MKQKYRSFSELYEQEFKKDFEDFSNDFEKVASLNKPTVNSLGKPIVPDNTAIKLENFWTWFGNSKVVDNQGRPLVVYHKSPNKDITTFKPNLAQGWGKGVYFSDNLSSLDEFGDNVYSVYLKIENPFNNDYFALEKTNAYQKAVKKYLGNDYEDYVENEYDFPSAYDIFENDQTYFTDAIYECGFDGIISENSNNIEGLELVVFKPNQIKSTFNGGLFSDSVNMFESRNILPQNKVVVYHGSSNKNLKVKNDSLIHFTTDKEDALKWANRYILGGKRNQKNYVYTAEITFNKPYIIGDSSVNPEYETYKNNKDKEDIYSEIFYEDINENKDELVSQGYDCFIDNSLSNGVVYYIIPSDFKKNIKFLNMEEK